MAALIYSIADNMERGKNMYVCLLDIKKAFDSVWQEGLFHKLFNNGLSGKTWRMLRFMYHDFKCMVRYGNDNSCPFNAYQGIHQGSPMSMLLFEVFINELLCEINSNPASAKCVGLSTGGVAFADDLALMSNSMEGLQSLVRVACKYSRKWRFLFNPTKCSIVQFGKIQNNVQIRIGADIVKVMKQDKHLGVILTNKEECIDDAMKEKIQHCKTVGYAVQALGSYTTPVTPKTHSKVYWSVCIPKLCYGTEILDVNDNTINNMESFHCGMAKQAQNLPKQCSNPGSLATLGWKNVRAHCNFLKLIFIWQLLSLNFKCIFKEVCVKRLCLIIYTDVVRRGPLCNILNVCKEYGLYGYIQYAVESGEYMYKDMWKQIVKKSVYMLETKRFLIQCKLYKTLYFMSSNNHRMCTWWVHAYYDHAYAKRNMIIVRLLLNVSMYLQGMCKCCTLNDIDNVTHILFICPCNSDVRNLLWEDVKLNSPRNLFDDIENMSLMDKTSFVLNACNIKYVHEWKHMFDSMSKFISNVHSRYMEFSEQLHV